MGPTKVEVSGTIKHEFANPVSIEVARGQKGSYGWTIKASGESLNTICDQIKAIDTRLKQDFPQPDGA
jgi:hypothetical protein